MRIPVAAVLAVLALSLAGCGDDEEPRSGGADREERETSSEATTEAAPEHTCDLADEADVEAAYGEPVPPGSHGNGGHDADGLKWQSENCGWEVEDGLDVRLGVSRAEDFDGGALLCPELDSFDTPSTPVPGLGDQAAWVTDEIDPNEGTLRICTAAEMIDIDVESPDGSRDPDTLRDQSIVLAGVVLANLGG